MIPIQVISDSTKASFAMEGMYATEKDEKNIMDVLTGKRTWQEVVEEIKKKYLAEKEK